MSTPNRIVLYLEAWSGRDTPVWREVDAYRFGVIYRTANLAQKWLFHGKFATVGVITQEMEITREIALKIATDTILGSCEHWSVNLKSLEVKKERAKPINPRQ